MPPASRGDARFEVRCRVCPRWPCSRSSPSPTRSARSPCCRWRRWRPFLLDRAAAHARAGRALPARRLSRRRADGAARGLADRPRSACARRSACGQLVIGGGRACWRRLRAEPADAPGRLVVAGFGFSVLNPSTGKAVIEWFPPRRRGVAMGIKQTGLTLGGLTGALTLPPLALALGWRARSPPPACSRWSPPSSSARLPHAGDARPAPPAERPRLAELAQFLRRPGVVVVFVSGLALSIAQSSVLAYLALYARETFAVSAVAAGQVLALAQARRHRRPARVGRHQRSLLRRAAPSRRRHQRADRRRRLRALRRSVAWLPRRWRSSARRPRGRRARSAGSASTSRSSPRSAAPATPGLLTGVAVAFAWSGVLVGPPLFGLVLELTGSYTAPWLVLAAIAVRVAADAAAAGPARAARRLGMTLVDVIVGAADARRPRRRRRAGRSRARR